MRRTLVSLGVLAGLFALAGDASAHGPYYGGFPGYPAYRPYYPPPVVVAPAPIVRPVYPAYYPPVVAPGYPVYRPYPVAPVYGGYPGYGYPGYGGGGGFSFGFSIVR